MMRWLYGYQIFTLFVWIVGYGLIVWQGGWILAIGVFLVQWANNMSRAYERLKEKIAERLQQRVNNITL